MVERVERMLSPLARAVEVELRCELEDHCLIRCTEDDFYQIAFNLMENAVKYNLPGGSVTVTLRKTETSVVMEVADTGVGIPEDDLDKIFLRFYLGGQGPVPGCRRYLGLGLSIVNDTVNAHGGQITVRRRQPEGSSFTVTFPRWREGEEA